MLHLCLAALTLALGALGLTPAAAAAEPTLTIQNGAVQATFTRTELLARPDVQTLTVAKDPAYGGQPMTYRVVPVAPLFASVKTAPDATIQFRCLDGFAAPISRDRLLNRAASKSQAYLAIEPADKPWPEIKATGHTAGPFYLVWDKPQLSQIGTEEWPFQLASFDVKGSLASLHPAIHPDPKLAASHPAKRGLAVFTKNCFPCHTLNKSGDGTIGPDLNLPLNPTQYMQPKALRAFIRDPQSVRFYPADRMTGFPVSAISEKEMNNLLAYLKHMAGRKVQAP